MTKEVKSVVETVDPAKLDYENPIFERLEEDLNNPWVLEEQIKFYKKAEVPIAHFAFRGQKQKHYYAVFEGLSKAHADSMNRMNNRDAKKKERGEAAIKEHETDSYEVMLENGYDAPKEDDSPDEIIAYKVVMDALSREYNALINVKIKMYKSSKIKMYIFP